jgi:hypothetical protein
LKRPKAVEQAGRNGDLEGARRAFVVLRDELTRLIPELKHLQNAESNVV